MNIYGIKNCDKVRAALGWAVQRGVSASLHDYRADGLDKALLGEFLQHFSLTELINRRSTSWRALSDAEKEAPTEALVLAKPTLIKRPLVEINGQWFIGFTPDHWQTAL